jgi:cathepsin C
VKQVVKVVDYGYVGGRYGAGNTSNIMMEIMTNGPVVLSFEPDYFFSLYTRGVYKKVDMSEWIASGLPRPEWIKIDHSVLCYGWGETKEGVKYWLL